jgi:ArsR family transcriptional regulator
MRQDLGTPILDRLQSLADATRCRLLLVLERHELSVTDLCGALQLPQSTVSRHLKTLSDEGWVVSRADGASRYYRMPGPELESAARRLWQVVKEQVAATPAALRDMDRLRRVLAERRTKSDEFFASASGQWDRMREELFGGRTELLAPLGLLDPKWVVGDLGTGTGQLSQTLAPFVSRVIAVDGSSAMLKAAKARLSDLPNVELRRGELEGLPIADGELDLGVLALVLPYVAEPIAVFVDAARVVRKGGRLIVVDMQAHDRAEYRQTMGHLSQGFAAEQIIPWMEEAGFEACRYAPIPPDPKAKGPSLFVASAVKRGN